MVIILGITALSLLIWVVLLCFWGNFWLAQERLNSPLIKGSRGGSNSSICAIIPARNEADGIETCLRSLLTQDYQGDFSIILVDDQSIDGTANIAEKTAASLNQSDKLTIITGKPLPIGWSGKLWALQQGCQYADTNKQASYYLLTDADIQHSPHNLSQLVSKAEQENLDLVSLMVLLRCESVWEKFLIPAFVFFFQKLYPFPWVNNPKRKTAAAAGGCILISAEKLKSIGGIEVVRQALIDDCSLATAVKSHQGKIWLGLTDSTVSLRPYPSLASIWDMVARTAFTQLNYSPWLLLGCVIGMSLVYLVAPVGVVIGIFMSNGLIVGVSLMTWLLMAIAYLPTIRLYQCSPFWAFTLPVIAFFYTMMTIDSGVKYWQGKGSAWKGRIYPAN